MSVHWASLRAWFLAVVLVSANCPMRSTLSVAVAGTRCVRAPRTRCSPHAFVMSRSRSTSRRAAPSLPTSTRHGRRQQAEAPVRVVRLQHYFHDDSLPQQDAEVPEPAASDEKKRQYRHQWMVRGFWRNTWFPSLQAHRVQWIAPHVRGPKDKPLLGGEKVFLVRTPPGDVGAAPNDPDPRTD